MATNNYIGEKFLNDIYKELFLEDVVKHSATSKDNKNVRVRKYLSRLKKMNDTANKNGDKGLKLLKEFYYRKYLIKEDKFPKKFFEIRKKLALNRGYGHIELSEDHIKGIKQLVISDQKQSLDRWLNFMLEDNNYPYWFKYYVFQGIVKIGSYDKALKKINKRTSTTTNVFVGINYQAISEIYENLVKVLQDEKIEDASLQRLLKNGNFGKIYLYMLNKINSNKDQDGLWRKYPRHTDYKLLMEDLQGKITNWCIEGGHSAYLTLRDGDVYVYYTKDINNNYTCPRIGMATNEDGTIDEVRGVAANQTIEKEMEEVVSKKLLEFVDGSNYIKKDTDMKKLTGLYSLKDKKLNEEELRFLYEIDEKILGFGLDKDPRINEILSTRNWKEDFSKISGCSIEDIKKRIKKY